MSVDLNISPQVPTPFSAAIIENAAQHVRDIVQICFQQTDSAQVTVVFDRASELADVLTVAYRIALPNAQFIDFEAHSAEEVRSRLESLHAGDLVVLIQSTNFRMDAYRIRVELFKHGLKVIEHPHLARMPGEQVFIYLDSLAYDADYYRHIGRGLKKHIDAAPRAVIDSGGAQLIFDGPLEDAKLNIGDYSEMKNWGGQFPIGEVFTEARDLSAVYGKVRIFVFGDTQFSVNRPEHPITLVIERGQVVEVLDSTSAFDEVIAKIKADEGVVWVRELGFGLNRAFDHQRVVRDIGTYERMCGIHLSLGAKHGTYGKPHIKRGEGKYHIDVFAITETVMLGEHCAFRDGSWIV